MTTERQANVRVNVTGNAAQKLGEVAKATETAGNKANAANSRFQRSGQAIDAAANAAKKGATAAGQLAGATGRADVAAKLASGSFQKLGVASISASVKLKAVANDATKTVGANQRATAAVAAHTTQLEKFTRAANAANAASRGSAPNTRIAAQVSIWQRLEAAARGAAREAAAYARSLPGRTAGFGGRGGRLATGVAAIGGAAVDAARGAGATLGVSSRDQLAGQFVDFDVAFARLSNQAGLDDAGKARLRQQVLGAARANMQDPSEVLAAMNEAQNRFSQLDFFADNANRFAAAATALGTPMGDIVGAVGEFQRQLGVTAEQVPELIGMMTDASARGSVEFSDISAEFATTIGTFGRVTGARGVEGARQFIGVAQVLGAGGAGGAGSATLAQNLLSKFSSGEVLRNFARAGVNTGLDRSGRGEFVGIENIVEQLRSNRRFVGEDGQVNASALQGILGADMQANQALGILLSEAGKGNTIGSIATSSAEAGNATIDRTLADIRSSAGGQALAARSNAAANFMENGDAYVRALASAAAAASSIDTTFPRASAAADLLRSSFDTLTGTLATLNMAGLAGAGGAAASAAGGVGAAGLGVAAAGAGTTAAVGIAGLMGGFVGGQAALDAGLRATGRQGLDEDERGLAGIGTLIQQLTTWDDTATNGSSDDVRRRVMENAQRRTEGGAAASSADPANTQATAENTRAVRELATALRANGGNVGRTADAGR